MVSGVGDVAVGLVAVLDPLSMAAQRASTLLSLVSGVVLLSQAVEQQRPEVEC